MEWVATSARTVAEATDAALDLLGVDASEAEVEIVVEPSKRWFRRTDAQVRARVKPRAPRAKQERRPRRRKGGSGAGKARGGQGRGGKGRANKGRGGPGRGNNDRAGKAGAGHDRDGQSRGGDDRGPKDRSGKDRSGKDRAGQDRSGKDRAGQDRAGRGPRADQATDGNGAGTTDDTSAAAVSAAAAPTSPPSPTKPTVTGRGGPADTVADDSKGTTSTPTGTGRSGHTADTSSGSESSKPEAEKQHTDEDGVDSGSEENKMTDTVTLDEQADATAEFLEGLLDAFGIEGDVTSVEVDDDTVEMRVEGSEELGLLIGPRGQTLSAITELNRAVLQRRFRGRRDGRLRIDIAGYHEKRRSALTRFAGKLANDVLDSGDRLPLEPMNAADRKVVHDTINDIDGVTTRSEGEDSRRHVVILPDD